MYCTDIFVMGKADCVGVNKYTNQTREWMERGVTYDWIGKHDFKKKFQVVLMVCLLDFAVPVQAVLFFLCSS